MDIKRLNNAIFMYIKPALETVGTQEHIMALTVDKQYKGKGLFGLTRVIVKREGNVDVPGFIDKSELYIVRSNDGLRWEQLKKLEIKGIDEIVSKYKKEKSAFIGLEDPDIWTEDGKKHVYFTMPFIGYGGFLGHAKGNTLEELAATEPVLRPLSKHGISGFKEVAISPIIFKGIRINLAEAGAGDFSVIATVKVKNAGKSWEYVKIALHPKETGYEWCSGHLSPCTFLPREFIDGKSLLIGIVNGREKDIEEKGKIKYGKFRPGLILYNPHSGEIPWISQEPLFEDPDATTVTFASDFLMKNRNEGLLYCHVNDSFVRTYRLDSKELKKFLPKKLIQS